MRLYRATMVLQLIDLKKIIEVTSNSTIRNYIGYRQQANVDPMFRKGIMWGEFWPERMIEKYNPDLIRII